MSKDIELDVDWLVHRRAEIQVLLLRLHNIANKHKVATGDARSVVLQLMLGVGFSLWRAVFLIRQARGDTSIRSAATEFLGLLIEDNSINYPQDKKTAAWSGGYYLNNALFRLRELRSAHLSNADLQASEGIRQIDDFLAKPFKERLGTSETELWELAYDTFAAICDSLDGERTPPRWKKEPR